MHHLPKIRLIIVPSAHTWSFSVRLGSVECLTADHQLIVYLIGLEQRIDKMAAKTPFLRPEYAPKAKATALASTACTLLGSKTSQILVRRASRSAYSTMLFLELNRHSYMLVIIYHDIFSIPSKHNFRVAACESYSKPYRLSEHVIPYLTPCTRAQQ